MTKLSDAIAKARTAIDAKLTPDDEAHLALVEVMELAETTVKRLTNAAQTLTFKVTLPSGGSRVVNISRKDGAWIVRSAHDHYVELIAGVGFVWLYKLYSTFTDIETALSASSQARFWDELTDDEKNIVLPGRTPGS
jgi:hypothetical protein